MDKKTRVLILGHQDESHARHMYETLAYRGCEVRIINAADFPEKLTLQYDPVHDDGLIIFPDKVCWEWSSIRSVYWRNYNASFYSSLADADQNYIANNDSRSLFESMLINLPARWVNGWNGFRLHQTKPVQLQLAKKAIGLDGAISLPNTVILNDPNGFKEFVAENKYLIFKPVQGGAHTRRLEAHHLSPEALKRLEFSPVTLQEEIDGRDIRVFVAGKQTLACEIHTQHLDFRNDGDAVITPFDLPDSVAKCCRDICRSLDLLWSGIDLKLTSSNKFYYLEANPSPMFIGFEKGSSLPLTESLAELLTSKKLPS